MTVVHLACAADERYVPHSAVMLHSALSNKGRHDLHVHYLHGPRLRSRSARRLASMVERNGGSISFLEIPDHRVAGLPEMPEVTRTMWYRIYLPELLPEVARVLYLDVDTLVLDSLEPLWETDLAGRYIAAVSNVWEPWNIGRPLGLGMPPTQPYFNSGVLLMNLELMRRDRCTGALREYALEHREDLAWPDQDTLNVILGSRHLALHPRWNCMNSVLDFPGAVDVFGAEATEEARRNPGIRHFEGPSINKPWHLLCERDGKNEYRRHRRQTPWPRYLPAGLSLGNILTRTRRAIRRRTPQALNA